MADWPDVDQLAQVLDLNEDPADWAWKMERDINAAIALVKSRVGIWDELTDEPDEALSNAALRAAVVMQTNVVDPEKAIDADPVFQGHMAGHRRRFSFA